MNGGWPGANRWERAGASITSAFLASWTELLQVFFSSPLQRVHAYLDGYFACSISLTDTEKCIVH